MRMVVVSCAVWTLLAPGVLAQERTPEARPPKKGDTISVKGCLSGTALEATDLGALGAAGELSNTLTFRLKGDKSLLKRLREEHDGKLVDVEGVLKSDLRQQGLQSRNLGKMKITIGTPPANPAAPDAHTKRSLPVLEVKSFEGGSTSCRH